MFFYFVDNGFLLENRKIAKPYLEASNEVFSQVFHSKHKQKFESLKSYVYSTQVFEERHVGTTSFN
jgi:hypothetical protein